MNVFVLILYMYAIAAAISFFVAFLISAIYSIIKFLEKAKSPDADTGTISTASLKKVQAEAALMEHEGEVTAVISYALYLYSMGVHDDETLKLTINKSAKPYSPWSSKIYGLNIYKR